MRILPFLFLALSLTARAGAPTPFDGAAWQQLLDKAVASNITSQDASGREYRSLQRISSADPTKNRRADYFSVVGNTQTDGVFGRNHVEIVVEDWQVDAQQIRTADQWAYALSLDGNLTFVMHQRFSENADGIVLRDERVPVPSSLDDAALLRQLGAKIQEWETAPRAD